MNIKFQNKILTLSLMLIASFFITQSCCFGTEDQQAQEVQNNQIKSQSLINEKPVEIDQVQTKKNETDFSFKNNNQTSENLNQQTKEKPFELLKQPQKPVIKNIRTIPSGKYLIHFKGRTIDIGKHLNFTTLLAIAGLSGTFFGLFSTWLIYHLNRKNNNPVAVDKHNSILKYIDDINHIKTYFSINDIKDLYENSNMSNLSDLENLILSYEEICKNVSKIDLIKTHTRYEKHLKKKNKQIFNSLINGFKMVKIDGDYLINNQEHHLFELEGLEANSNTTNIKNKISFILTFEKQLDSVLKILRKELKI